MNPVCRIVGSIDFRSSIAGNQRRQGFVDELRVGLTVATTSCFVEKVAVDRGTDTASSHGISMPWTCHVENWRTGELENWSAVVGVLQPEGGGLSWVLSTLVSA